MIVGLLVQLVLLPIMLPAWHAGDGLLVGGDWVAYQSIALELAAEIKIAGWSAWQLRPSDQAFAGIAAAIYALTGISKPWTILPLNAAVHATSSIILLLIVGSVTGWWKPPLWPVLPFIFFPTALLWNAQFHKDSLFILGSLLFLFGLLQSIKIAQDKRFLRHLGVFVTLLSGIVLIWIVRPYGVEMVFYIGVGLAICATVYLLFNLKNNHGILLNLFIIWLALSAVFPLTGTGSHHYFVLVDYDEPTEPAGSNNPTEPTDGDLPGSDKDTVVVAPVPQPADGPEAWQTSTLLPGFVDENLYKLAVMRDRYLVHKPEAGSNIDLHVRFSSAGDILKYIPRALQIGLFAPFPLDWFAPGEGVASSVMRQANALEMLLIYIALFALIVSFRVWYKNPQAYLALGFTLAMILSYALVVANVGTLNRMRYGFLLTIVALGIAFCLEKIKAGGEQNRAA